MASTAQIVLASLWWGPLRRPFEALARRLLARGQRVLTGPLRGVNFDGGLAQRLGIYELPVQEVLSRTLRPGDVVYDVGGHRGFFALLAARLVGPEGRVFVFEPVAESLQELEEAVRINGLTMVEALPLALSDTEGDADFFVREARTTASLLPVADAERRTVSRTTLDAVAAVYPPPAMLKIDVEGVEDKVLAGARTLLVQHRPRLVIELHGSEPDRASRAILEAHGYRMTALPAGSSRRTTYPYHVLAEPEEVGR